MGFPGDSAVKNLPVNAGDEGLVHGLGRSPGGGNVDPLQDSRLDGYSPWGHRVRHYLATERRQLLLTEMRKMVLPLIIRHDLKYCLRLECTGMYRLPNTQGLGD